MNHLFKNKKVSGLNPCSVRNSLFILLFTSLFMSGCATTCTDTVTLVPVEPKAEVKVQLPTKPELASTYLTKASTQDEVVRAALSDHATLKAYSEKLEKLLQ